MSQRGGGIEVAVAGPGHAALVGRPAHRLIVTVGRRRAAGVGGATSHAGIDVIVGPPFAASGRSAADVPWMSSSAGPPIAQSVTSSTRFQPSEWIAPKR
jgi:hypothetical protein